MRLNRRLKAAVAALTTVALVGCSQPGSGPPETSAARSQSAQRQGDEAFPQIVRQFGGEASDPRLKSYVSEIGQKLAARSEQPNAKWTFTVLDSPIVNAFATPGGYIYITRGLAELANSEAELAGVIGHEIGHVTAQHNAGRQERATIAGLGVLATAVLGAAVGLEGGALQAVTDIGQVAGQGYVANYSRGQEFEADQLGVRYLARAGYDPMAEAAFLETLQADTALQAKAAGRGYNPNRTDFLASHPATAERVREAVRAAAASGIDVNPNASAGRERHLAVIDGLVYGDSAAQGFVRGRRFAHPELRFEFTVPQGFEITNSAAQVAASGPNGAGVIFDSGRDPGGPLDRYIARTWAPQIAEQARAGRLANVRRTSINGLSAATADLPAQTRGGVVILHMTAIRYDGRVYRFLGIEPRGSGMGARLDQAARSFNPLSASAARSLQPKRIQIATVGRGDSVASLARRMSVENFAVERFRVLNGLGPGQEVQAGQQVKLIVGPRG